ncbi:hypothetical protein BLOT_001692, partial [Blomia tropicalis]
ANLDPFKTDYDPPEDVPEDWRRSSPQFIQLLGKTYWINEDNNNILANNNKEKKQTNGVDHDYNLQVRNIKL